MKSIKYLFAVLALSILACSDLEEKPVGLLSPEGFFQSPKDVETAVNGAIGHLQHENWWGRKLSVCRLCSEVIWSVLVMQEPLPDVKTIISSPF